MPTEYWIVDVNALNRIYQAAKRFLVQPDAYNKMALQGAIYQAEHPHDQGCAAQVG